MELIYDDYNDYWVWTLDYDEISPRFDEDVDAKSWYMMMSEYFKQK